MPSELPRRITSLCAASLAYKFAVHNFPQLVRISLAPIAAIAVVQYMSLRVYLSELMTFISSADPRAASLALGALTAGLFVSVFISSMVVSAVADLALGNRAKHGWLQFKAGRQEWRVYAAYLRFLLLATGFFSAVYLAAGLFLPILNWSRLLMAETASLIALAGMLCLFARIGFLIPAIVARSRGTVLRKALHAGAHDFARNTSILLLLSLPGLAIETFGEFLLRLGSGPARIRIDLPVAAYAQALEHRLSEFAILSSISVMVVLILLSAASVICYRDHVFGDRAVAQADTPVANLDSAPV
jgi:hypothetical protein